MPMRPIMDAVMKPVMFPMQGDYVRSGGSTLLLYDFRTGGPFAGLVFDSSFSGAVSRDSLIVAGPGEPRASSFGLLDETEASNKCENFNKKATDTSGTTPDGAWTVHERVARSGIAAISQDAADTLDQLDPQGNVTAVYRSRSNTAGVITIDGVTGNTNPHTPSVWHYTLTGDFGCGLSGGGPSPEPELDEWRRQEKPSTPLAGTETMVVGSSQASEILWFGNQLEETTTADPGRSSLIEVSGAAATRPGDNVRVVIPPGLDTASFTAVVEFQSYKDIVLNSLARTVQLDSGNDISGTIFYGMVRHTTQTHELRDDTAGLLLEGPAYATSTISRQAFGMDGAGNASLAVDGGNYVSAAYTPQSSYPNLRFSGRFDGTQQLNGYIRVAALMDEPATQEYTEQITALGSGWGAGWGPGFG